MTPLEKFMSKVTPEPNSGCWLWTAAALPRGYGITSHQGQRIYAHRLSLVLHGEALNPDMQVLHSCDNPACVNPAHLRQGTALDNSKDCKSRGRAAVGVRHPMRKLSPADVESIRSELGTRRLRPGEATAVLEKYNIGRPQLSRIRNGLQWKEAR